MEDKLTQAIRAYLPRHVIQERVKAPIWNDVCGGFREGTLVFADISGFTSMSEKLARRGREGAEELTDILNQYFTRMLEIAVSYQGIQIKFGGDAMLLLFEGKRHTARAVRCALQMQGAMNKFKRVQTSQGAFGLRMKVAVNAGRFFEAHLGSSEKRLYYVLTGREVNRTADIEGQARAGEVLVSQSTVSHLKNSLDIGEERSGYYLVKGCRSRVVKAFEDVSDGLLPHQDAVAKKLASYLPSHLRERLLTDRLLSVVQAEHRRVVVIFINLLGSTEVVERFGDNQPGEAVRILNDYFLIAHETVDKYGGFLIGCDLNGTGDKLLVVFGTPVAHEDDDNLALLCAMDLQKRLAGSGLPLQQRIGINSGHVFSAEVGSSFRKEYTVMGDTVNLAARLMAVAQEGQILVSRSVYSRVRSKFMFEVQAPVWVKGKSIPVEVYLLRGARLDRPRRPISSTELVGRDEEMTLIERIVESVLSGQSRVLTISGPAGVGKSRLATELDGLWQSRGGLTLRGDCPSHGASMPYSLWIGLLRSFFHLSEDESNEERKDKIEALISHLCPDLTEWAPLIGQLLSTEIPESRELKMLDPKLRHQRLLDMILELLLADSKRSKLLLLFEDVQWADSASIELLNYVTRNVRDCHILVCVVYRPEMFAGLDSRERANHVEIALRELSDRLAINLVRSITGMHDVPEDLGKLVIDTAQGNPLYVEEMVGSLIDAGYLTQNAESGAYELTRSLEKIEVPDTIQGIIMERLDKLGEETLNVLKSASVVGKSFQYSAVREILAAPASESDSMKNLDQLISLNMIVQLRNEPEPEYCFKHSLTQEVAYASMPFAQRRDLHDRLGQYLETRHKDDIEQYCELLCYHYVRAENEQKAAEYSIKAGDKAKKVFSNLEAIGYYRDALRYLRVLPRGIPALEGIVEENLGDVYELTGAYDRALESYRQSQRRYRILARRGRRAGSEFADRIPWAYAGLPSSADGGRLAAAVYRKRSVVYERKGQYNVALEYLDRGIDQITNDPTEMARFYTARAGVLYRMGRYSKAFEWCRRALEASGESTKCEETAHSYYLLGTICTDLGNFPQAIEYRMKALVIYEQLSDLVGQARVHNNLGVDFYYQGNWEMAKVHYRRSLQIRSKIGDVSGTATVSNNLGEILSDQGYLDEAEQSFQACLKTWGSIGYALGVGLSNSNLGRVYTRRGEWQRALEYLGKSYQILEQLRSQGFLTEVHQRLAEAYLGGGQTEAAIENCQRSLALATESDRPLAAGVSHRIMGQTYLALGDLNEAEREFTQSEKILRKVSATYELGKTLWQMALFYHEKNASKGRENAAAVVRQLLESALDIFSRLGIRSDAAKVAELKALYLIE